MIHDHIDPNDGTKDRADLSGDAALIPNSFMSLRSFDDASRRPLVSKDECSEAIEEDEGFSTRIWNMSTAVGYNELVSRLLTEPDGGVSCLKELNDCAELLGAQRLPR